MSDSAISGWLSAEVRCPDGHGRLSVGDRRLSCSTCGIEASITGGIPRFVEQRHLASFGRQWNRYEVIRDDEDRRVFRVKTGIDPSELAGLRVLDAGCGGGRYSRVAAIAGATVIGADHSEAVEKARAVCDGLDRAAFVQADLKRLPLAPASFDVVFSIGVMHHDADTRRVFDSVAGMVAPGGRLAVWLYRRNTRWQEWLNNRLRARTTRLPPEHLERWCRLAARLGGIPLLNRTLNKFVNFSAHPDAEIRRCDTFDWYAPAYQHHHRLEELCEWFEAAGFEDLQALPPEKTGRVYRWAYDRNLIVGSGVNVLGRRVRE